MKLVDAIANEIGTMSENIGFLRHRSSMSPEHVDDQTTRQPSNSKWDYLRDGEPPIETLVVVYNERIHAIKRVCGVKQEVENPIKEKWDSIREYDLQDINSTLIGRGIRGWADRSRQRTSMLRSRMPTFDRIEVDVPAQDFPDDVDVGAPEGAKTTVTVNRYERSRKNRDACIAHHGTACSACGLDFWRRYGEIGKGFIHVHHIVPVSALSEAYRIDPVNDLVPLCPNCHAMVHRTDPPMSVEELGRRIGQT